jgi:hypothetical protein
MNYLQLHNEVLDMMAQTISIVDPFPGLAASAEDKSALIDRLLLRAANNARKFAEKANPTWTLNEVSADVTVVAGGTVSLAGHTDRDTSEEFDFNVLNSVTHCGLPIFLNSRPMRNKMAFMKKKDCRKIYGVTARNNFKLSPALDSDVSLVFYGTRWMANYTLETTVTQTMTVVGSGLDPDSAGIYRYAGVLNGKSYYTYGNVELQVAEGALFIPTDDNDSGVLVWDGELWKLDFFPNGSIDDKGTWYSAESVATPDLVSSWTAGAGTSGTISDVVKGQDSHTEDGSGVTDWIYEHGFDYLQWATICELNYLLKIYLPRQEGGLPPPTGERDRALDYLIRWDTDLRDSQTNACAR